MKKILLVFLPTILLAVLLAVLVLQTRPILAQDNTGQQAAEKDGIIMLPSTMPVNLDLQAHVLDMLASDSSTRNVYVYAITNVVEDDHYIKVSVAGLPLDTPEMRLQDSIWLGMVTIAKMPGQPGYIEDLQPSWDVTGQQPAGPEYGKGGAGNILPFRSGTAATYGVLGVHNCGFSLNGWKAVDFFPQENMVYSTQSGSVSYVCRDGTQVALRIGNNLYTHLVDKGQQTGQEYAQGQPIAGMVPGSYNAACGYADQQENAYHVHFCFIPNQAGTWSADGWALSVVNQNWFNGVDTVAPTELLTANWQNADIVPGSAAGTNFWDSLAAGVVGAVKIILPELPEHQPMGIAEKVVTQSTPALEIAYIVGFSVFDMTIPMWCIGIIITLELIRLVYAGWMWVKRAIPLIG